jgi:hypothetical protein
LYLFIITIQLLPLFCNVTDRSSREASASSSAASVVQHRNAGEAAQASAAHVLVPRALGKYEMIVKSVDYIRPHVPLPDIIEAAKGASFTTAENALFYELLALPKVRTSGSAQGVSWKSFHKYWSYYIARLLTRGGEEVFYGRSEKQLQQKYKDSNKK